MGADPFRDGYLTMGIPERNVLDLIPQAIDRVPQFVEPLPRCPN